MSFTRDFTVMAARKVASALDVLTSDGLSRCDDWSDNNAFEALVTDYFTGNVNDSSEDLCWPAIGDAVAECTQVGDENTSHDSQEDMGMDIGKK